MPSLPVNNLVINCRNICIRERERERERERQLQGTIKPKHTCALIGGAIFKWMSKLNLTSLLLEAPFSAEYGETSGIKHAFIPIGCAIFSWLYFYNLWPQLGFEVCANSKLQTREDSGVKSEDTGREERIRESFG